MSAPPYGPPPGPVPPSHAPPKPGKARRRIGITLIVFGVLGAVLTGLFGYYVFGNRAGTLNPAYEATMWRNEPADELFPETIADFGQTADKTDERGNTVTGAPVPTWIRVGIAQETACDAGLTPTALRTVNKYGCEAVFRATYVDGSSQHVATLAMIILDDPRKQVDGGYTALDMVSSELESRGSNPDPGERQDFEVKAFPVAGTPAARWNDAARNGTYATAVNTHYVVVATTGAVDGRRAARLPAPWNRLGGSAATSGDRETYEASAKGIAEGFMPGGED